jgi:hypothetical protein
MLSATKRNVTVTKALALFRLRGPSHKLGCMADATVGDDNEHLRISLENYTRHTVPALEIDAYSEKVHQANQAAGL